MTSVSSSEIRYVEVDFRQCAAFFTFLELGWCHHTHWATWRASFWGLADAFLTIAIVLVPSVMSFSREVCNATRKIWRQGGLPLDEQKSPPTNIFLHATSSSGNQIRPQVSCPFCFCPPKMSYDENCPRKTQSTKSTILEHFQTFFISNSQGRR